MHDALVIGRGTGPALAFGRTHYVADLSHLRRDPTAAYPDLIARGWWGALSPRAPEPARRIDGPTILLRVYANWALFVRHTLAAVLAVRAAGIGPRDCHWLVTGIRREQAAVLADFGVRRRRIVKLKGAWLAVRDLHVPGMGEVHESTRFALEAAERLRSLYVSPEGRGPARIYVSRRLARRRRVIGEGALEASLAQRGYVAIDPGSLSPREQVAFFAGAEFVVGPHGMGLANAAFSSQLRGIVELVSADWNRSGYRRLAQLKGAAYGAFYAVPNLAGDLAVPPGFLALVDRLEAAAPPRTHDR